jgi:hypothetical protein
MPYILIEIPQWCYISYHLRDSQTKLDSVWEILAKSSKLDGLPQGSIQTRFCNSLAISRKRGDQVNILQHLKFVHSLLSLLFCWHVLTWHKTLNLLWILHILHDFFSCRVQHKNQLWIWAWLAELDNDSIYSFQSSTNKKSYLLF